MRLALGGAGCVRGVPFLALGGKKLRAEMRQLEKPLYKCKFPRKLLIIVPRRFSVWPSDRMSR
jgi:hypothetical protein